MPVFKLIDDLPVLILEQGRQAGGNRQGRAGSGIVPVYFPHYSSISLPHSSTLLLFSSCQYSGCHSILLVTGEQTWAFLFVGRHGGEQNRRDAVYYGEKRTERTGHICHAACHHVKLSEKLRKLFLKRALSTSPEGFL